MPALRVLVVDDSALMRRMISDALSTDPDINVTVAPSGQIALAKIEQFAPDVITLDIEMPDWDGITTLKEIKTLYPQLPVIMCSTLTQHGAAITLEALTLGAADYVTKPSSLVLADNQPIFRDDLIAKIKNLAQKKKTYLQPSETISRTTLTKPQSRDENVGLLVIGASTGGPNALSSVLSQLPENLGVPIVIVQHMPPIFTKLLADRINNITPFTVCEATEGDILTARKAWIAPGDFHVRITCKAGRAALTLDQSPQVNGCRPSVDVLFESAAAVFGKKVLGVVLTGMGTDSLAGCEHIKKAGGQVIVQDEASSVIWGMPGCVAKAGLANAVLPLSEIGKQITDRVMKNKFILF